MSVVIEGSFSDGFDWCIEKIKASVFNPLAGELEIHKALTYLKMREFSKAIKLLKGFEKKESSMLSTAATNLAFLYFLVREARSCCCSRLTGPGCQESDYKQAEAYTDRAIEADKYNPHGGICRRRNAMQ